MLPSNYGEEGGGSGVQQHNSQVQGENLPKKGCGGLSEKQTDRWGAKREHIRDGNEY